MTPGARVAAAIAVLDAVLDGAQAEKALTHWGRGNRYAGSGDRAAVRDLVYEALRNRRSFAWLGGAETGRGLMLGAVRADGQEPAGLFSGEGYAPTPVEPEETGQDLDTAPAAVALDLPDWLVPLFEASLGDQADPITMALKSRAPVYVRVNTAKADRSTALQALSEDGIAAHPNELAETALELTENARRLRNNRAYRDGLVELQDLSSQAACAALGAGPGMRVLDYCAGGGGKALALAATGADIWAHDALPGRLRDLPARARRAGAHIPILDDSAAEAPYDLVLCDAPCSGSGTWRRDPEGKWALTPARLADLRSLQGDILDSAAPLVAPGGRLAYATCSVLKDENEETLAAFLNRNPGWTLQAQQRFSPLSGGDGFYVAQLNRMTVP